MKKILIALAVLIVLAVAGGIAASYYAQIKAAQTVDRVLARLPNVTESSRGTVEYSLLANQAVVTDIHIKAQPENGPEDITISRVEIRKPNIRRLQNILGAKGDEILAESVEISGMVMTEKDTSMRIEHYSAIRPMIGETGLPGNIGLKDLMKPEYMPKLWKAVSVKEARMQGLTGSVNNPQKAKIALASSLVKDYQGGKVGYFEADGFSVEGEKNVRLTIQSISGKNLDYSKAFESLARYDSGSSQPVPMDLAYEEIKINGIGITTEDNQNIKLAEIAMNNYRQKAMVPMSLTFHMKDLEVEVAGITDDRAKQALEKLGYDKLVIQAGLDYAWDEATKKVNLHSLSFGLGEGGDFSLSFVLDGVDLDRLAESRDMSVLVSGTMLSHAELNYVDSSLASRSLDFAAASQGIKPEDLKDLLIAQIGAQKAMFAEVAGAEQSVDALVAFIRDPKSITITAEPSAPVPLIALAMQGQSAPMQLVNSLNLSLGTNGQPPARIQIPESMMQSGPGNGDTGKPEN